MKRTRMSGSSSWKATARTWHDIVTTAFVLNMDSKLLCKPDCKGLCCRCGANLNDGPCGCEPELDPRFAALKAASQRYVNFDAVKSSST